MHGARQSFLIMKRGEVGAGVTVCSDYPIPLRDALLNRIGSILRVIFWDNDAFSGPTDLHWEAFDILGTTTSSQARAWTTQIRLCCTDYS